MVLEGTAMTTLVKDFQDQFLAIWETLAALPFPSGEIQRVTQYSS